MPPEQQERARIEASHLFDATWYVRRYPDVAAAGFPPALHYLRHGAAELRDPGPWFDTKKYVAAVAGGMQGCNPLIHYLDNPGFLAETVSEVAARPYATLDGFLRNAMVSPVVRAPFCEEDKRCFAAMESVARYLKQFAAEAQQMVSVIMPARNREGTVRAAIDSVMAQTYEHWELIVIDDASEDGTADRVHDASRQDARVRLLQADRRLGVSGARNLGLAAAKGKIVAYLDSDNLWLEDYLACTVGAFESHASADAVYSGQYIHAGGHGDRVVAVRFGPMNRSLLENHNYIDLNCFSHRMAVHARVGGFSEELARLVDWDFILRISDQCKVVSLPFLQSSYYLGAADNTITGTEDLDRAMQTVSSSRMMKLHVDSQGLKRAVCVLIPSFQAMEHLKKCMESLAPYLEGGLVKVVVVDNASGPDVQRYLSDIDVDGVSTLFNSENYGFSYAVNQAAAMAEQGVDFLLLNNDARLAPGSLEALQQAAYSSENVAISVPRQVVPPTEAAGIHMHVPYAADGRECDVNLSAHHRNIERLDLFHDGGRVDLNFAPFFCAYIRREAWDLCAGLDHQSGRHYRSDRVMCDFMRLALARRIVYEPDALVYHQVQVATASLAMDESSSVAAEQVSELAMMLQNNRWPPSMMEALKLRAMPWDVD